MSLRTLSTCMTPSALANRPLGRQGVASARPALGSCLAHPSSRAIFSPD